MSTDEDTELRDLVAQALETNGVLNKIRAELRANVFLALEEQDILKKKTLSNKPLKSYLETKEGLLTFNVVREFLEFFNLDFTLAVLDPESNAPKATPRENLINELNMQTIDPKAPLLAELLRKKSEAKVTSPTSPRLSSKIPQRTIDKKPATLDTKDKRTSNTLQSPPLVIDNEDNDLFEELGVSPIDYGKKENSGKSKPSWLSGDSPKSNEKKPNDTSSGLGSLKDAPALTGFGSLKDAPPLTGFGKKTFNEPQIDVLSPEWDELINIDKKISDLGFEIPAIDETSQKSTQSNKSNTRTTSNKSGVGGEKKPSNKDDYNYEDDFNSSGKSDNLSITEEIEENLSIGSFGNSKNDDPVTSDHTVSQMSETGADYAEDAEFY